MATTDFESIIASPSPTHPDLLHLTLNRPHVRNALSLSLVAELHSLLDSLSHKDSPYRVVIFSGAGKGKTDVRHTKT